MAVEIARGALLEGYRLERLLGGGGSAAVWLSTDVRSQSSVALKILRSDRMEAGSYRARAQREADILKRLEHPNLARCRDYNLDSDPPYLVIELVEGKTLASVMTSHATENRKFVLPLALHILAQVGSAVDHAHAAGVVHRDLKPANVMISGDPGAPHVTVLDLGVAKILAADTDDPTTLGRLLGTFAYMSPEQSRGESVDHRSDIFSLGTLLFEMLTLRRPWLHDGNGELQSFGSSHGSSNPPVEVLRRINVAPRPRLSDHRSDLPSALDPVIQRALAIRPNERQASAEQLMAELRAAAPEASVEISDPTRVAPQPRSGTPIYATALVRAPTPVIEKTPILERTPMLEPTPNPTLVQPTVRVQPRPNSARLLPLVLAFGAIMGLGGWWIGMRMGAQQVDPRPPPPPEAPPVVQVDPRPNVVAQPAPEPPAQARPPAKSDRPGPKPGRSEPSPTANPAPRPLARLRALLAEIEAEPQVAERQSQLADAIVSAAAGVPDADRKSKIVRLARSSALVGDVEGLRRALNELEAGLGPSPP